MFTLQIRELGGVRDRTFGISSTGLPSQNQHIPDPSKTFAPMDVWEALSNGKIGHDIAIKTVDMHTSGEVCVYDYERD